MLLFALSSLLLLFIQVESFVDATEQKAYAPIRFTYFLVRNANLTKEEFHHQYSTVHAPLVTPWLKKYGILEYSQFHAPTVSQDAIEPLLGPVATLATYDAYTEFLVESVEVFQKALTDPFYTEQVLPHEAYLFGGTSFLLTAGYRQVHWKGDVAGVGV